MEPLIEFVAAPPKHRGDVHEELLQRDEVKQFIKYIDRKKPDPADYTAKNWREIMSKPNQLQGFGKLGDWYQYVQQKCGILAFYEGFNEQSSILLLQCVELLGIKKLQSGSNPKAFDWFNVDESYEFDEPKFNVREADLTFKINVKSNEYVTVNVTSCYWDRYSSEGQHVGKCGKMDVAVVHSTVTELANLNGIVVLKHDNTNNLECNKKAKDLPVRLSIKLFTKLATLLKIKKDQLVKFILDTCHYPFTKCDWNKELPRQTKKIGQVNYFSENIQHIEDEITQKMPNVAKLFQRGYTNIDDHIKLLECLQHQVLYYSCDKHCRKMMHLALKEDRFFDFSAAEDLVENTYWEEVSESSSEYSINVFDSNDEFEFKLIVKIVIEQDEYDDDEANMSVKLSLTGVNNEEMKQKLREIFTPYLNGEWRGGFVIMEDTPEKDILFHVTCLIPRLVQHTITERSFVMEIIELMHLDWEFDQFWKFLIDMGCMEEDLTDWQEERWLPELFEGHIDAGDQRWGTNYNGYQTTPSEEVSGESADDGQDTLMDLDEELNDLKMDIEETTEQGKPMPRLCKKEKPKKPVSLLRQSLKETCEKQNQNK